MAKGDTSAKKKRTRRRKRREVSDSSSSDDSASESEDVPVPKTNPAPPVKVPQPAEESEDDTESDDDESSDEDVVGPTAPHGDMEMAPAHEPSEAAPRPHKRIPSRSPSPPAPALPPFLPTAKDVREEKEKQLKDRFRKYWMTSLADAFADDLDEIRKEQSMTKSRLDMLIDSLASGADVFSSSLDESSRQRTNEEMELVLGEH
ncbi:hypothetical protein DACRYDRAFT_12791 [Dacryopinax primogenitus]|uniref:Ribosome assembly protein 3 n=1 Tax=Dacryopinax primogenitus (strain DJM 731) TaxID=1858805 RepID=M5GBY5_DACPD|nr:uncharacterized protein DACRYDRAFT_12791 [Dacryopinax primogenitus]EJU05970.1 hypothetical protein DACRYDRAFT_12791 [Dacryopinax primogenitus]